MLVEKTASVGEIQRNFAKVLSRIQAGDEITVTRHGKPVARIVSLAPRQHIDWPDFLGEAQEVSGDPLSEMVGQDRRERG